MEQKPSVGRMVHYVGYGTPNGEYGKECRAAIITQVNSDNNVGLAIFNPGGMFFNTSVKYDAWDGNNALEGAEPQGGTWHWPERV